MCELGVSSLLLVITHQIGFDEISDIAIHDSLYIGGLGVRCDGLLHGGHQRRNCGICDPHSIFFLFAFEFVFGVRAVCLVRVGRVLI